MDRQYDTQFGFVWGNVEVVRTATWRGRWMEITTPRQTAQVHVTPSGLIRVFVKPRSAKK